MDGANAGAEDTAAPYSITYNTAALTNGSHTFAARGRDGAGNTTTSPGITVTVSNGDAVPPTVTMTAPSAGATVSGTITISASASDNVGVAGVQFLADGANIGSEDTSSPYSISYDTTALGNGSHAFSARARDAAGNTTTAAGVTVTVSNAAVAGHPRIWLDARPSRPCARGARTTLSGPPCGHLQQLPAGTVSIRTATTIESAQHRRGLPGSDYFDPLLNTMLPDRLRHRGSQHVGLGARARTSWRRCRAAHVPPYNRDDSYGIASSE